MITARWPRIQFRYYVNANSIYSFKPMLQYVLLFRVNILISAKIKFKGILFYES